MKQMQDFREWLSAADGSSTPIQRHLAALTSLDRARLSEASSQPWFIWEAAESVSA